jgi:hypothetical protein
MNRVVMCLLAVTLLTGTALAEPQYSVLFGQSCFLCHTNATGRGMRSGYGSQFFGPQYLATFKVSDSLLAKVSPQLSKTVSVGADLRMDYQTENTQKKDAHNGLSAPFSSNTGDFAQMEGFLYINFQPIDKLGIYYTQSVTENTGRFEMYGMANILPFNGYVKGGLFQENYGWVLADHSAFVRTGLQPVGTFPTPNYDGSYAGMCNPPFYGAGFEVGFHPKGVDVSASYTNSEDICPMPRDNQHRWFARAQLQQGIGKLGLNFTGGFSWMLAPYKNVDSEIPSLSPEQKRINAYGPFAGIGWNGLTNTMGCKDGFGFLSTALLFEYDRKHSTPLAMDSTGGYSYLPISPVWGAYSTAQAYIQLHPGVWFVGEYDWMDNGYQIMDMRGNMGNAQAKRTSLGVQWFPWPWLEVSPRYRLTSLAGPSARNQQLFEFQTHFFF